MLLAYISSMASNCWSVFHSTCQARSVTLSLGTEHVGYLLLPMTMSQTDDERPPTFPQEPKIHPQEGWLASAHSLSLSTTKFLPRWLCSCERPPEGHRASCCPTPMPTVAAVETCSFLPI